MAIQSSGPLESAGMPITNAGRVSPGQNKTSSAGHGLWQQTRRAVSGGMSAVCSSRAQLAAWGAAHTVRESTAKHWRVARRAEQRLKRTGERFPRWEGLKSQSQATAFPFIAAEGEMNKRLPLSMGKFPETAFPFVAAKIGAERRLPRLASQLLETAFSFAAAVFEVDKRLPQRQSQLLTIAFSLVVADFEADERPPRRAIQFLATAFSFVAADFVPHLSGLSEGQAEQGSQSHGSRQYERGVAS